MKKLILFIACLTQGMLALGPTYTSVSLSSTAPVFPSSLVRINLNVRGGDEVKAWVNGAATGKLYVPYALEFTSVSVGVNSIVVEVCNDTATKITNVFTLATSSTARLLPRKLYR